MSGATRALVLAGGTDPYTDPWHPFAETSAVLAALAESLGYEVEVSTQAVTRLADLSGVDLLIANVPAPSVPLDSQLLDAATSGLRAFLARPSGVFALHVSVTTLLGLPQWSDLMGARWVQGETMHPPRGASTVSLVTDGPLASSAREFMLDDELYSYLAFSGEFQPVITHDYDGVTHPIFWLREVDDTRVVADALGHSTESFTSPDHVEIVLAALQWAAAATKSTASITT